MNVSGFCLRAVGRLREAVQPMQTGLNGYVQQENWQNAASAAGNLSELYLTLGEVKQAVTSAHQSVDFANRSGDEFQRKVARAQLGDALHQTGKLAEALELFREAEGVQQHRQPMLLYLYSRQGFQFCELLLNQGQYQEVQKRAAIALQVVSFGSGNLLDIALNKLSLGRAVLLQVLAETTNQTFRISEQNFTQARELLQQAVAGLREAGQQDELPRGLLARAACSRAQNEFALASADLEEAREIAERGEMKLHLADYHLEAGRLHLAQHVAVETFRRNVSTTVAPTADHLSHARQHLAIAKEMIEQMGYGRRKPELEELEKQIKSP